MWGLGSGPNMAPGLKEQARSISWLDVIKDQTKPGSVCPLSFPVFLLDVFCAVHQGQSDYVALFCVCVLSLGCSVRFSVPAQVTEWQTRLQNDL